MIQISAVKTNWGVLKIFRVYWSRNQLESDSTKIEVFSRAFYQ